MNVLQSVIGFNQEILEDADNEVFEALQGGDDNAAVTDELLPEDSVTCWTCGSEVDPEQIETTVEKLRDLSQDAVGEINDIESELDDLKDERRERENQQQRQERLQQRQRRLDNEIEETQDRIETLSERREQLREEIEIDEAEVEELENEAYEEILNLHKQANQLEYKLGSYENDLEYVDEEIRTIENRLEEEGDLEVRRDEINKKSRRYGRISNEPKRRR